MQSMTPSILVLLHHLVNQTTLLYNDLSIHTFLCWLGEKYPKKLELKQIVHQFHSFFFPLETMYTKVSHSLTLTHSHSLTHILSLSLSLSLPLPHTLSPTNAGLHRGTSGRRSPSPACLQSFPPLLPLPTPAPCFVFLRDRRNRSHTCPPPRLPFPRPHGTLPNAEDTRTCTAHLSKKGTLITC